MARIENWEVKLQEALDRTSQVKFEYGTADCTTWSAMIVKSYTDLEWEATWTNETEALKQQKDEPMEDQVSKVLKKSPRSLISQTKRGDVVQKGTGMKAALGIFVGQGKVAFVTKLNGLTYIPLTECTYSWEI